MILNVLTFILSTVTSFVSLLGNIEISNNVSFLSFLVVWQLLIILIWALNKLAKGSGSKGNSKSNQGKGTVKAK